MRVTHLITRLIIGGAQENTLASVLGLRQLSGMDVHLISGPTHGPEGSLEPLAAEVPGLLTLEPSLVRPVHPWHDTRALVRLIRTLKQQRPDIVHTHSGKAGVLGRFAASRAGVPIIIHTIHGPSFGPFQGALANTVFRNAERLAARVTTHFVAVADAMTEQYLAAGIGSRERYTRIFSGFDLAPYLHATDDPELRARLGLAPGDVVIGMIARLFKLKGHEDLFAMAPDLVRRCPRVKFLLVGDGVWRTRLEQLAAASGLRDRVVFAGLVPPADVARYVGIMDILVHLSQREGLPRALPQALAAAKPVVAYDCDGAREVCFDNETGFLVRPGHTHRLVQSLQLLVESPQLREQFGARGRDFVRRHFSVEMMVDDLYRLYQRLTKARASRP
ncbi:MAG TPA: glycosyltransferase family 4 protein [Verrucomicrobiae bacterium]